MDTSRADALYFIALLVPPPLDEQIRALQQELRNRFGCRAAFRSPPHITLHMPFKWQAKKEQVLTAALQRFAAPQQAVHITLQNFGSFPPRVIFVQVGKTPELDAMHSRLTAFCRQELKLTDATWRNGPFHPHVTLAFRDLKKKDFAEAWQEFQHREFGASFMARSISLLQHNGHEWQPKAAFPFASAPQ
jgi:2'-5' RNA ligase